MATRHNATKGHHKQKPTRKQLRAVYHFAMCLSDAVKEFEATDTSSAEERLEYDPVRNWGDYPMSRGVAVGYYNSLIEGYIELNLILMDPKVFVPLTTCENQGWSDAMRVMCGDGDGSDADWLVELISPAFEQSRRPCTLKPPTAEVLQILRDHSARLFRCLYSISGGNSTHDVEFVMKMIALQFTIDNEQYEWLLFGNVWKWISVAQAGGVPIS